MRKASFASRGSTIAVVGAGVIGLTTAIRLLEAGFDVTVLSRDHPTETVSAVAAAYWHPFAVAPEHRVLPWARTTYRVSRRLATDPSSGVCFKPLRKYYPAGEANTYWMNAAGGYHRLPPEVLPEGATEGYELNVPVMDSSRFVPFLVTWVEDLGGAISLEEVESLASLSGRFDLVVNCAGLGARHLAEDTSVAPIRGQVLRVSNPDQLEPTVISFDVGWEKTYIVPRVSDCILGGTAHSDSWDRQPSAAQTEEILERCARLQPALKNAEIHEVLVGLRPSRPEIRLTLEEQQWGVPVIHNYGHGGAGYTVCWGCASAALSETLRISGIP